MEHVASFRKMAHFDAPFLSIGGKEDEGDAFGVSIPDRLQTQTGNDTERHYRQSLSAKGT